MRPVDQTGRPQRSWLALLLAMEADQLDVAARHARTSLAKEGPSIEAFVALSQYHQRRLDLDKAGECLEQAQALEPGNALVQGLRASVLLAANRTEEARQFVDEALAAAPDDDDVLMLAAGVVGSLGDRDRALEILDGVLDPNTPGPLALRAELSFDAGEEEDAEELVRMALEIDAADRGARLVLLKILLGRGGDPEELRMLGEGLLREGPGGPLTHNLMVGLGFHLMGVQRVFRPGSVGRWLLRAVYAGMAVAGFGLGVGLEVRPDPVEAGLVGAALAVPPTWIVFLGMRRSMVRRLKRVSSPIAAVFRTTSREAFLAILLGMPMAQCQILGALLCAGSVWVRGFETTPLTSLGLLLMGAGIGGRIATGYGISVIQRRGQ